MTSWSVDNQRHFYRHHRSSHRLSWTFVFSAMLVCLLAILFLGPTTADSKLLKSCSTGGSAPDYPRAVRDNWGLVSHLFGRYLGWSPTRDSGRQLMKAMLELSDVPDEGVKDAVNSVNDVYRERYLAWLRKCQPQTLGR